MRHGRPAGLPAAPGAMKINPKAYLSLSGPQEAWRRARPASQDGAAAAAAAGGSAGGAGERHCPEPAGQAHQHPPGGHGGPFGLRVHGRQLRGPLMKTRSRTFSTLLLVVFVAFLWKHWDALLGYVQRFFSSPR